MIPPMLPVVSLSKKTSTNDVVGPPALIVTVLDSVKLEPVGPDPLKEVGLIESAIANDENPSKANPNANIRIFLLLI
jgi:hypothetical protein